MARVRAVALIVGIVGSGLFAAQPSLAAQVRVTTFTDELDPQGVTGSGCSLREAISTVLGFWRTGCDAADAVGENTVILPGGVHRLTRGVLSLGTPLTGVTIQGRRGLTFATPTIAGGALLVGPTTVLRNLTLDNTPVEVLESGVLVVGHSVVRNANSGRNCGGAFFFRGGSFGYIHDSWIHHNGGVANGGGICAISNSYLELANTTFSHNGARQRGGAVALSGGSSGDFTQCTFSNNFAGIYGGGIHISGGGSLGLWSSTIVDNRLTEMPSNASGGGGLFGQGHVTLARTILARNTTANNTGHDCRAAAGVITSAGQNFIGKANGPSATDPCPIQAADGDVIGTPSVPAVPDLGGLETLGFFPVDMPGHRPLIGGNGRSNIADSAWLSDPYDQVGNPRGNVTTSNPWAVERPADRGAIERQQ